MPITYFKADENNTQSHCVMCPGTQLTTY